jgi:hypothetical protein
MTSYRKIWEQHNGPIPYDEDGRRYEIHHIDGNRSNNKITNLQLVTIQEHYNIHYSQSDWAACQSILTRMKLSPSEHSKRQSDLAKLRILDGTHHFTDPEFIIKNSARGRQRTKHLNSMWGKTHRDETKIAMSKSHRQAVESGTHHTQTTKFANSVRKNQARLISEGKHNFQNPDIRTLQIDSQKRMIGNGTHPLQDKNRIDPNKILVSCIHCRKETTLPALTSHHKHNDTPRHNPGVIRMCCVICKKETSKGAFTKWHIHKE